MPEINFYHSYVGSLSIDNGVDEAQWAYGLNLQHYPTYGGEVVQILSVFIDNLTLTGTCSTYAQLEAIYKYFTHYLIGATQGHSQTPVPNESYNLDPMTFTYPDRNWTFQIYPLAAPGFQYRTGGIGPQWQLQAFIIDDSPDLGVIKDGIKAAAVKSVNLNGGTPAQIGTFSLTGDISPKSGNPNADPFQTEDPSALAEQAQAAQWADFYNSLLPSYMTGNFASLASTSGSKPNFGQRAQKRGTNSLHTKVAPKRRPPR